MSVLPMGLAIERERGGSKSSACSGECGGDEMAAPMSADSSPPPNAAKCSENAGVGAPAGDECWLYGVCAGDGVYECSAPAGDAAGNGPCDCTHTQSSRHSHYKCDSL